MLSFLWRLTCRCLWNLPDILRSVVLLLSPLANLLIHSPVSVVHYYLVKQQIADALMLGGKTDFYLQNHGRIPIPVFSLIQSKYQVTRVNPAGSPASHPRLEPNDTTPTCVRDPSVSTKGPPESPPHVDCPP